VAQAHVDHPAGTLRTGNISDELAHPPGLLEVIVVSPAKPLYHGNARWITVRAWDGQMGIWPRHADLVAALGIGLLRIGHPDGSVDRFTIWGGFLKVGGPKVTILVDRAIAEADVKEADARKGLDEALAGLRHPQTGQEFQGLLDRRRWFESQLRMTRPA